MRCGVSDSYMLLVSRWGAGYQIVTCCWSRDEDCGVSDGYMLLVSRWGAGYQIVTAARGSLFADIFSWEAVLHVSGADSQKWLTTSIQTSGLSAVCCTRLVRHSHVTLPPSSHPSPPSRSSFFRLFTHPGAIMFSGSRREVNSTWYSEIEEPIKSREKHYSLVLYILTLVVPPDGSSPISVLRRQDEPVLVV